MVRNLSQATSSLPTNAILLEFPRSDGNPSLGSHPSNTTKSVDVDGGVNYYRPVPLDEASSIKWRQALGTALATKLNKPAGVYALKEWPEHYRLYDHNKGPEASPRHDLYLIGSSTVNRFRSIPEFIPHAFWLMGPESESCTCKYCSGSKSQKTITQSLVISGIRLSHTSASPAPSAPRAPRTKPSTSAPVIKPPPPPPRERPKRRTRAQPYVQQRAILESNKTVPAAEDRILDLRAINQPAPHSANSRDFILHHRTEEIVWCILPRSIHPDNLTTNEPIAYWPAIIKRPFHKVDTIVTHDISPSEYDPNNPNFKTEQLPYYEIDLLGVARTKTVEAQRIMPFIATKASIPLLNATREVPREYLHYENDSMNHSFDPMPDQPRILDFKEAAAPFALAVEMACSISQMWALSDGYEFKYTVPLPEAPKPPATKTLPRPPRQHALLANVAPAPPAPSPSYAGLSGMEHNMSPERVQEVALNVLGIVPKPGTQHAQTRFQGLWWGGERIWTGDLVRLKPGRYHIAPNGSENLYKAAGPSATAVLHLPGEISGDDINKYGALSRGVLMKIETIMIIERPSEITAGETKKECRLSGPLYEVVDDDWVDDSTGGPVDNEPSDDAVLELPQPPATYKFRNIQKKGSETVLSLTLLGGRYYPNITSHQEIQKLITRGTKLSSPVDNEDIVDMTAGNALFALEGLVPGFFNSMDPISFKHHRESMLEDARRKTLEGLTKLRDDTNTPAAGEDVVMMDIS